MFKEVNVNELNENFVEIISKEWMLVSAGDKDGFNTMTASWGSVGEMWGRHCALAVIRPQRYTKEFVDNCDYFTLSFYGDNKAVHKICGNRSGRDTDKVAEAGLTPVFDNESVYFEQARLVLVCKKLYVQKIKPDCFIDKSIIDRWYPEKDFHVAYVGEIVKALVKE